MKLYPAIDILNNRAVRLLYGDKTKVTDYGTPAVCAKSWVNNGAKRLHIVDLDGAFDGVSKNLDAIIKIKQELGVYVQTGGGIRTFEDVKIRLESGIDKIILGTAAIKDQDMCLKAIEKYGNRIILGVDALNGLVSVSGWVEGTKISPIELIRKFVGIDTVVFTDISRDGAMSGVNVSSTVNLTVESGINVIASGGVSCLDDLKCLSENSVYGAILGKSIYSNAIDLKVAIEKFDE